VPFVHEGSRSKLELVRGLAATVAYWPRVDGQLVAAAAPVVRVYDPAGALLAEPAAAVQPNKSVTFDWTPPATADLAEDYRYEIDYTVGGKPRKDVVYLDVCRVSLACPIDQNQLEALEPDLPKWLAARNISDAQRWIVRAWDDILGRIRAAGFRPALVTDRHVFAAAATELALVKVLTTLIRQPDDLWDRKRELHEDDYEAAWAAIGALKFESPDRPGPVAKRTVAQPRFRR
jgi:hypothetical protein